MNRLTITTFERKQSDEVGEKLVVNNFCALRECALFFLVCSSAIKPMLGLVDALEFSFEKGTRSGRAVGLG